MAIPGLGPVVAAGWLVSTVTGAGIGAAAGGLVGSLTGAGMSEADAHAYSEGVRRGGTLVTVRAGDRNFQQVVDILEEHGSVDMDERERSWRSDGWEGRVTDHDSTTSSTRGASEIGRSSGIGAAAGTTAGLGATAFGTDRDRTAGMGSTGMDATAERNTGSTGKGFGEKVADTLGLSGSSDSRSTERTGMTGTDRSMTGTDRMGSTERHEAIPIVEENLEVGKREVNRGRVRVHSHTVETPVQEQVTLRDEHVSVERRAVDRPVTGGEDLFRDRTIEAVEHDEEAVVSKQARVKEELVIDKDVEQRTQTVSDTVRHTEVEVEDERGNRVSGTGTTGNTGAPFDRKR
jgi:uncharacterized protein (TIGR02271 family)